MQALASREEWFNARLSLLEKEKHLIQQLDALAQERRQLPLESHKLNFISHRYFQVTPQ